MLQIKAPVGKKMSFASNKYTHTHNYGHFMLPLRGEVSVQTERCDINLNTQHVMLVHPNCEHTISSADRNECLVIYIPLFMFSTINTDDKIDYLQLDTRWRALRLLMLNEVQDKEDENPAINDLLYYSFRLVGQKEPSPSIRYIHDHYHRNISLETLAGLEHYNAAYYSQWFKKKTGVTPQTYIHTQRLNEAKRLLRETHFSILDIAQQVGYEHQSSLTRLFKQFEGVTPQFYRQRYGK